MAVTITNQSRQLVIVPLNSGDTIHLAPREVSRAIADFEVAHNAAVKKLAQENFIRLLTEEDARAAAPRKAAGSHERKARPGKD